MDIKEWDERENNLELMNKIIDRQQRLLDILIQIIEKQLGSKV